MSAFYIRMLLLHMNVYKFMILYAFSLKKLASNTWYVLWEAKFFNKLGYYFITYSAEVLFLNDARWCKF